jgi:hypothetical protein
VKFDYYRDVVEDGICDETAIRDYVHRGLVPAFLASPEGDGYTSTIATELLEAGLRRLGVTPAGMDPAVLREVLLDAFPNRTRCWPKHAPEIVAQVRALFAFARRAYGCPAAAACIEFLDQECVVEQLRSALRLNRRPSERLVRAMG